MQKPEASHSRTTTSNRNGYRVVYASNAAQHQFEKAFKKLPSVDVESIKESIRKLRGNPRQRCSKSTMLSVADVAQFRLRIGNYRVLYDLNDEKQEVVLHLIARRNEKTYR